VSTKDISREVILTTRLVMLGGGPCILTDVRVQENLEERADKVVDPLDVA